MNAIASSAPQRLPHPSPHRGRVSRWAIWFAIAAAPAAWNLQLLVNVAVTAHGCYPHDMPLADPIWSNLRTVAAVVELIAILVCIAGAFVAWRNWSRTRNEKPGSAHHLIEAGDGRMRFMAMVGIMVSALFFVAVIFAAWNLAVVPACGG